MKWLRTALIIIASLVLLALLADVGLNWWIERRLPRIINEVNDSPYQITYKDLDVSLTGRTIVAREIIVVPKISLNNPRSKAGIYGKIKRIDVSNFNLWDIIFSNRLVANSLMVDTPELTLLRKNGKAIENPQSIRTEVVAPFSKIIYVSDVMLEHGSIKITEIRNNKPILDVADLSLKLEGIFISDETLEKKLPFNYKASEIKFGKAFYRMSEFYHLSAENATISDSTLHIAKVKMVPRYSRAAFVKTIRAEKDLYAIAVSDIYFNKMEWGFRKERFFFNAGSIVFDGANADIYRSKIPKDDLTKKKLYNRLLREIPFEMKVDTLRLKNSKVVYEEEKDFKMGPGVLTFSRFNLRATGISSAVGRTKMPDVKIRINCRFMNTSRLHVDWHFNVLDRSDGFNIRGRIFDFPAGRLAPFTKPYVNATIKGDLDEIYFNFTGNDRKARGDLAVNYDDLKVTLYKKKNPKKKNKLKSAIVNLFVKNDSRGKVTNAEVELDRIQEKSFYNFLWRSVAQGLKKIML
jgi:hypothetical protein